MQENQPSDNPIAIVSPETKKQLDALLNNEPMIPLRNDRPEEYELKVRCEDGFTFVLQKRALNKIVKEGALEDRIRNYRNALDEQSKRGELLRDISGTSSK